MGVISGLVGSASNGMPSLSKLSKGAGRLGAVAAAVSVTSHVADAFDDYENGDSEGARTEWFEAGLEVGGFMFCAAFAEFTVPIALGTIALELYLDKQ